MSLRDDFVSSGCEVSFPNTYVETYCAKVRTGFGFDGESLPGERGARCRARARPLEVRSSGGGMSSATRLSPFLCAAVFSPSSLQAATDHGQP